LRDRDWDIDDSRVPVLVVEDEPETRLIYEKFLRDSVFQMIAAASIRQARDAMQQVRPRAIVLDILLRGEDAWRWLAELKTDAATRAIPVLVATTVEDEGKGYALGADAYCVKPLEREVLLDYLERLTSAHARIDKPKTRSSNGSSQRVLIIDDQAASRYILAKLIDDQSYLVRQAANATEGLRMAKEIVPQLIFLDLDMPDISGFEVLMQLKSDPATGPIPVAVVTSLVLSEAERQKLETQACAIISKSELSRARIEELLASVLPESAQLNAEDGH
jgi:CheY-like chemotaxis protein